MTSISIVSPLYNSSNYIDEFYKRVRSAVLEISNEYEIIFIDDGSPDDSSQIVQHIIEKEENVRLIQLSRNFGHHKAILAGLNYCKGDLVFLIDCDLEEKPELLTEFYKEMNKDFESIDVVYGYFKNREGRRMGKKIGFWFYKLINAISDIPIPENAIMGRLMKRKYVDEVLRYNEAHVFIGGIFQLAGFNQIGVPVTKADKGETSYTLAKRITSAIDAVASFSTTPLLYMFFMGLFISFVAFMFIIYLVVRHLFFEELLAGWPSLMVSVWLIGGLIISCLGLVGFYLGKIFIQVKNRPPYIIRKIYNG